MRREAGGQLAENNELLQGTPRKEIFITSIGIKFIAFKDSMKYALQKLKTILLMFYFHILR